MTTAIVHHPTARIDRPKSKSASSSGRPTGPWPLVRGGRSVPLRGLKPRREASTSPRPTQDSSLAHREGFLTALDNVFADPEASWTRD